MGNIKPEPIEAHRCPKCDLEKIWKFEEAQKHVDIEEDTPLPKSLIYFDHDLGDRLVVIANNGRINSTHAYTHKTLSVCYGGYDKKYIDSREFKEKLQKGDYSLAKPENMDFYNSDAKCGYLLRAIHSEEFVRTTPELEEIVAQKDVVGE